MRHLLLAVLTALFTATAAPAFAMSINFSYIGTVSSDVSYNLIFPSPSYSYPLVFGQNLTGKSVFVSETFNLQNADLISQGSYIGSLGGFPGNFASAEITIGNVSAPLQGAVGGAYGSFTPTLGGFSSEASSKAGLVSGGFAFLDYSSTFTQNGVVADASLRAVGPGPFGRTLDFNVSSETFAVSAVPLPPALPLFAAALLVLGIIGYVRRAKDVTPAHGQAY
jgi:hypothetical protein